MDGDRIRTSLRRAPSGFTAEQRAANERRLESGVWHAKGKLVIDINDYRLPLDLRAAVEAIGIKRFGKRERNVSRSGAQYPA